MHGKERKGITYYACSYRISYGDKAAEALGHGKWQYVREDVLLGLIDCFFEQQVFGADRVACFREQQSALLRETRDASDGERDRLERRHTDLEQRIALQVRAIEAGVDPVVVRKRIEALKAERDEVAGLLAGITEASDDAVALDDACEILDSLPDLGEALVTADPELRRRVFDAFRLSISLDRNARQIQVKALVSSAFRQARDLQSLVANESSSGGRI
jgi:hypothetical protein